MSLSSGNAFSWASESSSFAADPKFRANKNGLSKSQRATITVEQRKSEQGWCPGVIWGLSARSDRQAKQRGKRG